MWPEEMEGVPLITHQGSELIVLLRPRKPSAVRTTLLSCRIFWFVFPRIHGLLENPEKSSKKSKVEDPLLADEALGLP